MSFHHEVQSRPRGRKERSQARAPSRRGAFGHRPARAVRSEVVLDLTAKIIEGKDAKLVQGSRIMAGGTSWAGLPSAHDDRFR